MGKFQKYHYQNFIDQYGTRKGIVRTYWHKIKNLLGLYGHYKKIDWDKIDRLVFVCKGNICRSAYAEVVAKSLGVSSISCGVSTKDNVPANKDAVVVADSRGISLKEHKTSRLTSIALRPTDLLIAMEPCQANFLCNHLKAKYNITLLGLWSLPSRPHIVDPYGLSPTYFNNCFEYIENSVHEITKKIKKT